MTLLEERPAAAIRNDNPDVLHTARLILRPPREEDLDGWAELMGDEESARYIGGQMTRSAAWRTMATMTGSWVLKGFGMFSVVEKGTGKWIGRVGPWQPEQWPGTEVGWGLVRSAWGKGYARESAEAAITWAFDALGWDEVIHIIALGNVRSAPPTRGRRECRHRSRPSRSTCGASRATSGRGG